MTISNLVHNHIRIVLQGITAVGLAFSTIGADNPPGAHLSLPGRLFTSLGGCHTQVVRITLATEQISFCAPTSRPFHVLEDSRSDASVNYAGLDQVDGYGILNIKATVPRMSPGPGRPIYDEREAAAYRQAVWNTEIAKTDRIVTNGPVGLFWEETIPSIQVDVPLPTSAGNLKVRSIEWYMEHANRLWSFIITWDTEMQNASEWETAAQNISFQKSDGTILADTATDPGAAFLESQAEGGIPSPGTPVDVGTPAWWSGVCDDGNYFSDPNTHNVHSVPLGASWHGVPACGPVTYRSPYPYHVVQFFPGAWGEIEFECIELIMRFLYQEWGIKPWGGNANQIAFSPNLPSSVVFYPNDGTHAIVPGDIITEDGSTPSSSGHAVIVTGVNVDGNGTGSIAILEQNSSSNGSRSLAVANWMVTPDAWTWGSPIQGWLHVIGNDPVVVRLFLPLIVSPGN